MARGFPLLLAALGGVGAGLALGWFSFRAPDSADETDAAGSGAEAPAERPGVSEQAPLDGGGTATVVSGSTPTPTSTAAAAAGPAAAAEPAEPEGPVLSAVTPPPPERYLYDADVFRDRLLQAYRNALGREMSPDYLEAAIAEGERLLASTPGRLAARWSERETLRGRYGEIAEPVDLLLQVRGEGEVSLVGAPNAALLSPSPLDLEDMKAPPGVFVRGGTVPVKALLAIEEIELRAVLGRPQREGRLDLQLGSGTATSRIELRSASSRLRGVFRGRALVEPFGEERSRLIVRQGDGEVRLRGRLVAEADRASYPPAVFRLDDARPEGFLVDSPIRLQAVAPAGRAVVLRLNGSSPSRPAPEFVNRDVWGRAAPDPRTSAGYVYADRAGLVPPHSAFEVQRIAWRVRFESANGRFDLTARGLKQPIRVRANVPGPREGEWTGSFLVAPGEEAAAALSVVSATVGEAVLYGRLVPR